MSKKRIEEIIARTGATPLTTDTLTHQLRRLGVTPGTTLLVHSSLSSLGWVSGGATAVIAALDRALEPGGTLVMPAHSSDLSEPSKWIAPPVPESWWEIIRETMPPFDPESTPTRGMGRIAELFRTMPGVLRSPHPQVSFVARGARASTITAGHSLDFALGEETPLSVLYELGARILLLGVGHANNTSLHLAEYRAEYATKRSEVQAAPMWIEGARRWLEFQDLDNDDSDFERLGLDYERATGAVQSGQIGLAASKLMDLRPLVEYAVHWMERYRSGSKDVALEGETSES